MGSPASSVLVSLARSPASTLLLSPFAHPRRFPLHSSLSTASSSLLISRRRVSSSSSPVSASSSRTPVEPPNLEQLCEKARLSLTPEEVADFTPKITSVVDWFAQLQDVNVDSVPPAIRVGQVDGASTMRADVPVVFQDVEAMLAAAPKREGPYLKVPKILKENVE